MSNPVMTNVPGRLHDPSSDHVVSGANEIFDDDLNKRQSELNDYLDKLSKNGIYIGSVRARCDTPAATANKEVTIQNFILVPNIPITIIFTYGFGSNTTKLNINNTGAKTVKYLGNNISAVGYGGYRVKPNAEVTMIYDGTQYNITNIESASRIVPNAVDMGLPSGTLWCDYNVGAVKPTEEGYFFSWGNVAKHTKSDSFIFTQANYTGTHGASLTTDIGNNNADNASWLFRGSPWTMPRTFQFSELLSNSTKEWLTVDGVVGVRYTSNINGNSIFIPAAGKCHDYYDYVNSMACLWCSDYVNSTECKAYYISESNQYHTNAKRYGGLNIRPVIL